MATFDWQAKVRNWCRRRRYITRALTDSIVEFFRQSFENALCPDRTWFGIHPRSGVSLVVGGIYLAAIQRTGKVEDKGLWLLLTQTPPTIDGVSHQPVKSSRDPLQPLIWAHAESLHVIPDLLASAPLWASFRAASQRVFTLSRSAAGRDPTQERRGKQRLSEFWSGPLVGLFPDEVSPAGPFVEGVACRITVNAYERNPAARQQCVEAHQRRCQACGFDFGAGYGPEFDGLIHVHHLRPLSKANGGYLVDPVNDLVPVCPNCHAVIHHGGRLRSIEEVRQLVARQRRAEPGAASKPTGV